jgi:hypothetical protein
MKRLTYVKALESGLSTREVDFTNEVCELLSIARECDQLKSRIVDSANDAARHFANVAEEFARGDSYSSNPIARSTVQDLPLLVGQLVATKASFWALVRALFGKEFYRELRILIEESALEGVSP